MNIVVFHGKCSDGIGSAWVARRYFKSKGIKDVQYIPYIHGTNHMPASYFEGANVFFVDVCWNPQVMKQISLVAKSLVVLDHHISSFNRFDPGDELTKNFDMAKCGTLLAWNYFFNNSKPRKMVSYINDADLYVWEHPHSLEVVSVIHDMDFNQPLDSVFDHLDCLDSELESESGFRSVVVEGTARRKVISNQIAQMLKLAIKIPYKDSYILSINSPIHISEVGNIASEGLPFALIWYQRDDGKYSYSFRSHSDGEDVSVLAGSFGGGGHRCAAGATSSYPPTHDMFIGA